MLVADPRVCISVLNWNGAERTLACLDALTHLDYPDKRIVVVDNASTDDSLARITAAYPDLDILRAESNGGYAAGNALALRRALDSDADLFWILNNDSRPAPDALRALVDAYGRHGAALYGSVSLEEGGEMLLTTSWALDANGQPDYGNLLYQKPLADCFPDGREREVANLMGNSFLIPLDVARQHGFMDSSFFLYWEETDYCFRLRRAGVHSYLVPSSRVYHGGGQAHKHDSRLKPVTTYYNVRNRLIWARRHLSGGAYVKLAAQNIGFTALRYLAVVKHLWIRTRRSASLRVAWYATRGVWDGLRGVTGKTIAPEQYI
jgi:GT2 family glycosyltransferase